jgi:hypothetical protein
VKIRRAEIIRYSGPDRARIESEMIEQLVLFVTGARGETARGESYLICSGPAAWIERIMMFLLRNHLAPPTPEWKGTLNDLRSEARLRLIFDANLKRFSRNAATAVKQPLKYL